jgi:isoprenylcysteine carboxyl methyltransferase (ICMT) family protein YpbQ
VVIVEIFALPAAFGLARLALVASAVNAVLLFFRIRDEEALLEKRPGYREHFGRLARFVPHVF